MSHADPENLGNSQTGDSDEIQEMFCEHCEKHDNKYTPAEGFCMDCVEYMCDTCFKYHKRYVTGHTTEDKDSMPQDFCFEKCSVHSDQLIKFYCNNCKKIACSDCKASDHQHCGNVSHLPTLVEGIEKSEVLKDLIKNMDKLSEEIEKTEKQVNDNIQKIADLEIMATTKTKSIKERLLATYQEHQKKHIDSFDKKMKETIARLKEERKSLVAGVAEKQRKFEKKLCDNENDVTEKIVKTKNADQKELQSIKAEYTTLKSNIRASKSDLIQKKNIGQRCQLFVTMKKMEESIEKMDKQMSKLKVKNDIHYYTTASKVTTPDINSLEKANTYFRYEERSPSTKKMASHCFDLPTKKAQHQSLCVLNESTLLVADFQDDTILVHRNIQEKTVSYDSIKMSSKPWDITKVEDNKAAVTFYKEGIVRLITFSDSMIVVKTDIIKVGAGCRGIAYSNNHFIVSSYDTQPGKIQILDMCGNILKCFDKDSNDRPLFTRPWYLALSPDHTIIYVSDIDRNTVTSLTFDGKVEAIYKDDQLKGPCQLTVDRSGTVYVCGRWSHNVHQLTSDLKKVKILLNESHGMYRPESAAYCQNNNRLYVGMWNNNIIKVFNLSLVYEGSAQNYSNYIFWRK